MGNRGAKERKAEMRTQHEKNVADDQRKIDEDGEAQKRAIEVTNQNQLAAEKKRNEAQVAEAARNNLADIRKKNAEINALRDKQRESLLRHKNTVAQQTARAKEKLEEKFQEESERREEHEQEEAFKVSQLNRDLDNQRNKVLKMNDEGTSHRTALQETHKTETARKTKEHQNYILESNAAINQIELEGHSDMKALAEMDRQKTKELTDKKMALQAVRTQNALALLDQVKLTSTHDELRTNCKEVETYFTNFRNAYRQQERPLTRMLLDMKRKAKLSSIPQPSVVYSSFDALDDTLNSFVIPKEFEGMKLNDTLEKLQDGCGAINESFLKIEGHVTDYQAEIEKADRNVEILKQVYDKADEEFATMKEQIKALGELIKVFNIPLNDGVDQELNRQMKTFNDQQKQILGNTTSQKQLTD